MVTYINMIDTYILINEYCFNVLLQTSILSLHSPLILVSYYPSLSFTTSSIRCKFTPRLNVCIHFGCYYKTIYQYYSYFSCFTLYWNWIVKPNLDSLYKLPSISLPFLRGERTPDGHKLNYLLTSYGLRTLNNLSIEYSGIYISSVSECIFWRFLSTLHQLMI